MGRSTKQQTSDRRRAAMEGLPSLTLASGFTIVELMVTVTVAGILTALAVPAMRSYLQNDRLWTQANSMVMSMNAARSEAIKQDVATGVSVCPTADGKTCDTSASASWAQGWIVVSTVANSNPVMTMQALPTDTKLAEASALPAVTFLSDGTVLAAAAFTMCDARGASMGRYVEVTSTGRVASSKGQKLNGAALTCPP